jgi:hypothetical protein
MVPWNLPPPHHCCRYCWSHLPRNVSLTDPLGIVGMLTEVVLDILGPVSKESSLRLPCWVGIGKQITASHIFELITDIKLCEIGFHISIDW